MYLSLAACLTVCISLADMTAARELKAGVARVNITPPIGTLHCAIGIGGHRGWVNQGIHDDIFAKILVLNDGNESLTVVSLDLLGFDPEGVRKQLPASVKNTMFCATHNHLGAATISFTPPDFAFRTPYLSRIEKEIAEAIITVHGNLEPVKIGVGKGTIDLSYNKLGGGKGLYLCGYENPQRIRYEPVDQEVGVIRIDDTDGNLLAVLVNYASHPVVAWTSDYVSAEYPGYMTRTVEKEIGGKVICFFFQGACGDTQPYESCSQSWEKMEQVGRKLADTVLDINSRIETAANNQAELRFSSEIIPLSGIKEAKGMTLNDELNTVVINDYIALVSGPGEFFVDFQLDLKKRSPLRNTFFFGYTNGYLGYLPTRKAWKEDWNKWYNHNLWVEVGAGEKVIEKALENIRRLSSN